MNPRCATGICVLAVALASNPAAIAGAPPDAPLALGKVQLLDVPYVPQSDALCGGAALAMVLRYWGMSGVRAEDFAVLAQPGGAGIRTGALVEAVEGYGWTAVPLPGTPSGVQSHLEQGRPVIALIRVGAGTFHYVVLVAWANGWVILHDPKRGPFRALRDAEFGAAWAGSGDWALLVLPPPELHRQTATATTLVDAPPPAPLDACGALVEAGVLLAQQDEAPEAELKFLAAQSLCPTSAEPLRERAGLRFRVEDFTGAKRLAQQALGLDPSDGLAWRLLGASCFLAGDTEGALAAWNHVFEPRTDLTRIDGLTRIRYSAVAGQLDLPPGELLTPQAFRRARRRLAEMPAQLGSRLSLRPEPEGNARVDVALVERPPVIDGVWDVGGVGLKALVGREVTLDVASPTGNGELWTAGWRWWQERPRVSLALTVPAAGGRPGIWRVGAFWERQAYGSQSASTAGGLPRSEVRREERRRTELSFADWLWPDVRLEVGLALDRWVDRGGYVSLAGSIERRCANDRLALGAQLARWANLGNRAPFGASGLSVTWRSSGLEGCDAWRGRLGLTTASSHAPLALWSGAGTGQGRAPLLRAHPLLDAGVIAGPVFGRTVLHGTIERQAWPWTLGPLRVGCAVFVDGAKPWDTGPASRSPLQLDGGAGLRLRALGAKGEFRLDAAHGFADGNSAVSVAWQVQ